MARTQIGRLPLAAGMLLILAACPQGDKGASTDPAQPAPGGDDQKTAKTTPPEMTAGAKLAQGGAASQPGATAKGGSPGEDGEEAKEGRAFLPPRPSNDADYKNDPDIFPKRLGITRLFLRADKINTVRDPAFIPGSKDLLVMAKVGGLQGIWRLPIKGGKARMVVARPLFTPGEKGDIVNRGNWYIGTPSVFPDGKHVVFDGSQFSPTGKYGNVIGIAPIHGGGTVSALEMVDVMFARTPDVNPDGKSVLFAACTEIREATLKGRGTQRLKSRVVVHLKRLDTKNNSVCTVHRPRFSPDGSKVVFESLGQFLHEDLKEKYKVPLPINAGDYLIEPWIANVDGTGIRRLVQDETYERDLGGRVQSGGSKEPDFTADGKWVVFAHGRSTVMVSVDGSKGKVLSVPVVETNRAVQFLEGDPATSPDGRYVAMASNVLGNENNPRPAPPAVAIIDLKKLDVDVTP